MGALRRSDDGPSIPKSFVRELKRISPQLEVRWYSFYPAEQGTPLLTGEYGNTEQHPIPYPRFYIYSVDAYGKAHLVKIIQNEDNSFRPLDGRVLKDLESDTFRVLGLKKLLQQQKEARENQDALKEKQISENAVLFSEANAHKIREAASDPGALVRTTRDAKIFSTHRGQAGEVEMTPEERGWIHR